MSAEPYYTPDRVGAICPTCGGETIVYDKRGQQRKRECLACGACYITAEEFRRFIRRRRKHYISENQQKQQHIAS